MIKNHTFNGRFVQDLHFRPLLAQSDGKKKKSVDDFSLLATKDVFKAKKLNIENALSRQWSPCVNKFI